MTYKFIFSIILALFGILMAVAGLGGVCASFVVRIHPSSRNLGIPPLEFIINNFRTVCALQVPIGLLLAAVGGLLARRFQQSKITC